METHSWRDLGLTPSSLQSQGPMIANIKNAYVRRTVLLAVIPLSLIINTLIGAWMGFSETLESIYEDFMPAWRGHR